MRGLLFLLLFWKSFKILLKTRYQNPKSVLTRYKQFSFQFMLKKPIVEAASMWSSK